MRRRLTTAAVAALLLAAWGRRAEATREQAILLVLHFQNLSSDPKAEYLAEALAEALATALARAGGLHVVDGKTALLLFCSGREDQAPQAANRTLEPDLRCSFADILPGRRRIGL